MRSFSYVLAACVVTVLAVISVPALVSRPLDRMVRRCIEALPLYAFVVVSDQDGVLFQQFMGRADAAYVAGNRTDRRIEVTSISRRLTVVAIAAVASRASLPAWHGQGSTIRHERLAVSAVCVTAAHPVRI